ncbi:MAG: cytochrome c3 family protein [Myxococcaceae bacterium]
MDLLLIRRLAVVAALLAATAARGDLFSPGELARPHASFEGLSNCTQCHPAGKQLSAEMCLVCHTELKGRVAAGRGLHGRLNPEQKEKCQTCHPDHQGRSFAMVDWGNEGEKAFDHKRTGWPLKGGHAPLECQKCHEKRRLADPAVRSMLGKQPGRKTQLGLSAACYSCHFDEHRGQLGNEGHQCQECHDDKKWKPAPLFDHADTEYPLKGRHKNNPKARCEDCHPKKPDEETAPGIFPPPVVAESFVLYSPVNHRSCLDCHKDPHTGRFGQRCQSCHTVEGWRVVRNAVAERQFHDKTRYPLRGAHADVECTACHNPPGRPPKFKGLVFDACSACHYDSHLGQIPKKSPRASGPACDDCHTVEAFTPSRFAAEEHQKTRYPLEGGHRAVACGLCHPRQPGLEEKIPPALRKSLKAQKRTELFSYLLFDSPRKLDRPDRCEACHADVHAGQFAKRPGGCTSCHKVAAFTEVAFDHTKDSRYPLTGKHATAKCGTCHSPAGPGKPVRYKPLPIACEGCHADVHAGQLVEVPGKPSGCERCHDTVDFKKTRFEHGPPFTTYRLEGRHAKAECKACHFEVPTAPGVVTRRYKPLPIACDGCHADFHRGAFQGFEP